jgi:hypothetical protein
VDTSADFCRRSFEEKSMSMDESDVDATFKLKVNYGYLKVLEIHICVIIKFKGKMGRQSTSNCSF